MHRRRRRELAQTRRSRTKRGSAPIGEDRIHRNHVLPRIAVSQRARAAGIVAGHAADGGARRRRDIDRKPQAVRFQRAVEILEHDARFDHTAPAVDIQIDNAVEIFRAIDHQRRIHRLPALRGAAAARQNRDALLARNRNRPRRIVHGPRRHHSERHDLIMRGVGGVTPAGEAVEAHIARDLGFQPPLQPRPQSVSQT